MRARTSPAARAMTIHTAARTTKEKTRSPDRYPEMARRGDDDSRSTVAVPASRLISPSSLGGQQRSPGIRDLLQLCLDLLHDGRGERRVEERGRMLLPVVDRPPQELHERTTLGFVLLILVDEQPREARDGIGLLTRGVRQRHAKIGGHVLGRPSRGPRRGLHTGLSEVAGPVLPSSTP